MAAPISSFLAKRQYGVLVVDDQESIRKMLDFGLRHHGFAVFLAANGHKAFDVYRCHFTAIDVVLLDVRMPDRDGPQTLVALQSINPLVRSCFMSGDAGSYTVKNLMDLGAMSVFTKPFCLTQLATTLRDLAGWTRPETHPNRTLSVRHSATLSGASDPISRIG